MSDDQDVNNVPTTQQENRPALPDGAIDLETLINHEVVLDTFGPIVYLGTLTAITQAGFWLKDADVHDCREGHALKEEYVIDARRDGIRTNRSRVFVMQSGIASLSPLADVVAE